MTDQERPHVILKQPCAHKPLGRSWLGSKFSNLYCRRSRVYPRVLVNSDAGLWTCIEKVGLQGTEKQPHIGHGYDRLLDKPHAPSV